MNDARNLQAGALPNLEPVSTAAPVRSPQFPPRASLYGIVQILLSQYNSLRRLFVSPRPETSELKELQEIRLLACQSNDINEHLETMFVECLLLQPRLIVELGVRDGVSTFVFERAAKLCDASVISADVEDCSSISRYERWHFYHGDDVQFASEFNEFCTGRNIVPSIDLLFVDTSHFYEHTVQEIHAWFPLLAPRAKVLFHDTNSRLIGRRKSGGFALAWDNRRGVIRAIEEYLGIRIDERREGVHYARNWLIRHTPFCNGLTILDRIPE
jgi:cephalosporin hydroxylase